MLDGLPRGTGARGEDLLTGMAVSQSLKRCAVETGLVPDSTRLRSLRHFGAEIFRQASGDVRITHSLLTHDRLDMMWIYPKQLTSEEHRQ
jgi:site-specific recombinase XerC